MALCFKIFQNLCIAHFMDKSATTFMWFLISWEYHMPPVETPFTLPFFDASVNISTSAGGRINTWPLPLIIFVPTISDQVLSFGSKQFCLNENGFPLKMIFAAPGGNDSLNSLHQQANQLCKLQNWCFRIV